MRDPVRLYVPNATSIHNKTIKIKSGGSKKMLPGDMSGSNVDYSVFSAVYRAVGED